MFRFIIQGLLLISAATLVVDAVVAIGIKKHKHHHGKRSAEIQGLPYGCQAEVDVEKRDGSEEVDFVVCVKGGKVCTTRDVATCSRLRQECETFKPPTDKLFAKMFPKAYAQICQEPTSGELCLYTDIEYKTCDEAKIMNDKVICITLSNGEEECSEIPQELLIDQKLIQSDEEDKLPPYRPLAKVNGAKTAQFP